MKLHPWDQVGYLLPFLFWIEYTNLKFIINNLIFCFIAGNANNEIGGSNECATEDLAKEMMNKKVLSMN